MEFGEINETVSTIIIMAAFATIIYACYVVIGIHRMNKGIYNDHKEYKKLLFADAMRSYHADELDHIIPDGILNWSLKETKQFLKDNKAAFREAFKKKYLNLKF